MPLLCSPHLLTIRERISLGRNGDPVSAELLRDTFHGAKGVLDQSIELENGALTHFEVCIIEVSVLLHLLSHV